MDGTALPSWAVPATQPAVGCEEWTALHCRARTAIFWKSPSKVGGSADGLWFQSRPDMAHVTVSADAQPSVHEPEPGSAASSSAYSCTREARAGGGWVVVVVVMVVVVGGGGFGF
eukprot:654177-Prymnesium_polylepis.1